MKLYLIPGACSQAVHILLKQLNVPFETEVVDSTTHTTASGADYLKVNPAGYVPALELENGTVITEVPAVLQYLADQHPKANLAPANGTTDRAFLQGHLNFVSSELHKAYAPLWYEKNLDEAQREKAVAKLMRRFGNLNDLLADGRPYLMGAELSIADFYAFVICSWAGVHKIELSSTPFVRQYIDRLADLDVVQETLAEEGLKP